MDQSALTWLTTSMDVETRDSLSPQQQECLRMVWQQQSSKEIGLALGISRHTVDGYISEAVTRLGARDRRHAARLYFGDLPPDPFRGEASRVEIKQQIDAASVTGPAHMPPAWTRWLPFRTGAHNDIHPLARIVWIFVLAALGGIGFGTFAIGIHLLNQLIR